MAQKIMKTAEEEYDAKQPPVEKKKDISTEAEQWKQEIMAVQDEDLLRYIGDIARAQCDLICADDRMNGERDENEIPMP